MTSSNKTKIRKFNDSGIIEREDLKKDLSNRKEILDLRVTSLEKQEDKVKLESKKLQEEVMKDMKKKDG